MSEPRDPNVISLKEALERGERVPIPVTTIKPPTKEEIADAVLDCHRAEQDLLAKRNRLKNLIAVYEPSSS